MCPYSEQKCIHLFSIYWTPTMFQVLFWFKWLSWDNLTQEEKSPISFIPPHMVVSPLPGFEYSLYSLHFHLLLLRDSLSHKPLPDSLILSSLLLTCKPCITLPVQAVRSSRISSVSSVHCPLATVPFPLWFYLLNPFPSLCSHVSLAAPWLPHRAVTCSPFAISTWAGDWHIRA